MKFKTSVLNIIMIVTILSSLPFVGVTANGAKYNPIADVDRDGDVDIFDIVRVAGAYGSEFTLPHQSNQTLVYVYQLETYPPEVQNARIAIIDPNYHYQVVQVEYTNSTGIANFTLNPNSSYTAIAWSSTTYSYANFTTNEFREATVTMQLAFPQLPSKWIVVTFLNETTGALFPLYFRGIYFRIQELTYQPYPIPAVWNTRVTGEIIVENFEGILNIGPWCLYEPHTPGKSYGVAIWDDLGDFLASLVYTPDGNSTANIVIYV